MTVPVLEARNVHKSFRQGPVTLEVLQGVAISVAVGERIAIVGASGSGKTTLLQILGGLDRPTTGHVLVDGKDIHEQSEQERGALRNRALGFVYQFHHLLPEFSAIENIMLPQMIAGLSRHKAQVRALELLDYLGLTARAKHRPAELSGGEQQRIAIARAVANAPGLLLADTADHVFSALETLVQATGLATLVATHSQALASQMTRRVTLDDGRVREME
jgi:lipoprotein-releasing system ATP-binding protein